MHKTSPASGLNESRMRTRHIVYLVHSTWWSLGHLKNKKHNAKPFGMVAKPCRNLRYYVYFLFDPKIKSYLLTHCVDFGRLNKPGARENNGNITKTRLGYKIQLHMA